MKRKSKNQSKNKTLNFLRYLGPGLLVTVGFIDPGNWASNIAAGVIMDGDIIYSYADRTAA